MKVHCSAGVLSPSCELCPNDNDPLLNSWCSGNCYFNEEIGACKEGKEQIRKVSDWLCFTLQASLFKCYNGNFINADEYEHFANTSCLNMAMVSGTSSYVKFNTMIEAKEYCSSEPKCLGIRSQRTDNYVQFHACSYPSAIPHLDSYEEQFDLHKKIRSLGKSIKV